MITVGMDYKVAPGKDGEFLSVFRKVIAIMEGLEGHTRTKLYRDTDAEHDYLVVSEWSDRAAFEAFIASERFKNVAAWGRDTVLRARPKHAVYGDTAPAAGPAQVEPKGCPMHRATR